MHVWKYFFFIKKLNPVEIRINTQRLSASSWLCYRWEVLCTEALYSTPCQSCTVSVLPRPGSSAAHWHDTRWSACLCSLGLAAQCLLQRVATVVLLVCERVGNERDWQCFLAWREWMWKVCISWLAVPQVLPNARFQINPGSFIEASVISAQLSSRVRTREGTRCKDFQAFLCNIPSADYLSLLLLFIFWKSERRGCLESRWLFFRKEPGRCCMYLFFLVLPECGLGPQLGRSAEEFSRGSFKTI